MTVNDPSVYVSGQAKVLDQLPKELVAEILAKLHVATKVNEKMQLNLICKKFNEALLMKESWKENVDLIFCPIHNNLFAINGKRFTGQTVDSALRQLLRVAVIQRFTLNSQVCNAHVIYPIVHTLVEYQSSFMIKDVNINMDGLQNPNGVAMLVNAIRSCSDSTIVRKFVVYIRCRLSNDFYKTKTFMNSTIWSYVMGCINLRHLSICSQLINVLDFGFLTHFLQLAVNLNTLVISLPDLADTEETESLAEAINNCQLQRLELGFPVADFALFVDLVGEEVRRRIQYIRLCFDDGHLLEWSNKSITAAHTVLEDYPNAKEIDINFSRLDVGWDVCVIYQTVVRAMELLRHRTVAHVVLRMRTHYQEHLLSMMTGSFDAIQIIGHGVYEVRKGRVTVFVDTK